MREIEEVTRLREFMEHWEASMEHVARELRISSRTVFRWLHGQSEPSDLALQRLSDYLAWVYPEEGKEAEYKGYGYHPSKFKKMKRINNQKSE